MGVWVIGHELPDGVFDRSDGPLSLPVGLAVENGYLTMLDSRGGTQLAKQTHEFRPIVRPHPRWLAPSTDHVRPQELSYPPCPLLGDRHHLYPLTKCIYSYYQMLPPLVVWWKGASQVDGPALEGPRSLVGVLERFSHLLNLLIELASGAC